METQDSSNLNEIISINNDAINQLKAHQNFSYSVIGGISAMLVGAVLWAFVTYSAKFQVGYMAIGVGALIGLAVRFFGLGIEKKFGILAAVLSLLGCLLGNLLSQVAFIAQEESLGYIETLSYLTPQLIGSILIETFSFIDILFYGLAISAGYSLAFRKITPALLQKIEASENLTPAYQKFRLPSIIASVLILSLVYFTVSNGVNGQKTYYYESGKIMSEGELKKSKLDGKWTYYNENGQITLIGNYNKGVADGKWEWFNEDENLIKTGNYKNGLENGEWITYYANKQVSDSGTYINGRKEGYWVQRYENGNLALCGNVKRDLADGIWTSYFENGQKAEEIVYEFDKTTIKNVWDSAGNQIVVNGTGTYKSFSNNGIILSSGELKDGKHIGIWKIFHPNGELSMDGSYENDVFVLINAWDVHKRHMIKNGNGFYTSYYPDGETVYENGEYKNGLREGYWKTYHETSDNLLQETNYTAGKLNGTQKTYYESGAIAVEGIFTNNLQNGLWNWFFEDGTLNSSVTFLDGKKEGVQTMWNEWGQKTKEEVYKNGEFVKEKTFL